MHPNFTTLDGKALTTTELSSGDLIIEGWAADFTGLDRQGENFAPDAFTRGIKSFVDGTASLNFHHRHEDNIGRVLDLREVPGRGLWMKARVDHQEPSSPLRHVYNGVRKGSIRGLSVGGFFKRKMTAGGWRIADVDLTEISVTPVPVHARTGIATVGVKALQDRLYDLDMEALRAQAERLQVTADLMRVTRDLAALRA